MTAKSNEKRACPACKGAGRVLLLITWARCDDCGGTGNLAPDRPLPAPPRGTSTTSFPRDPEDDPSYFDDGLDEELEGDDDDCYGFWTTCD